MNFFKYGFIYFSFSMLNISAKSALSQDITSPSSRSRVVVFDVDDTLCKSDPWSCEVKAAVKYYPECPILFWISNSTYTRNVSHVFLPHLQILFDYLIEQDVRIVFFSSGDKERNLLVIPQLLTSFWGKVKFEALKAKGQFDIFSKDNCRWGNKSYASGEGNLVKDLKVVIQEGETLSDVILVDDDYTYSAYDQRPLLVSVYLSRWRIKEEDKKEKAEEGAVISSWEWEEKHTSFYLNGVYFMIGVFKTYFENEKYKILPFREALDVILPEKNYFHHFFEKHSFAYDMYELGLSEVQKRVPNAMFYGLRHPHEGSYYKSTMRIWKENIFEPRATTTLPQPRTRFLDSLVWPSLRSNCSRGPRFARSSLLPTHQNKST